MNSIKSSLCLELLYKATTSLILILLVNLTFAISAPGSAFATTAFTYRATGDLTNKEILEMVKGGISTEVIKSLIKSSVCKFDTSPQALSEMKKQGVPDAVVVAMIEASGDPAATPVAQVESPVAGTSTLKNGEILIPDETPVEVELADTVSSDEVKEGSTMRFKTIHPVEINGVTVIEAGALAVARVRRANGSRHWGRSGKLEWAMQATTAVDGTKVPLQFEGKKNGEGKVGTVVTAIALTSLLSLPLAFLWGFKKGKVAKIPAGSRFQIYTYGDTTIKTHLSSRTLALLASGIADLSGIWSFGDQTVTIAQNGSNFVAKFENGKAKCNGTVVEFALRGKVEEGRISGELPVCTQPELMNRCNYSPVTNLRFQGEWSDSRLAGTATVPDIAILSSSGGVCGIFSDKRKERTYKFQLSRVAE